MHKLTPDLIEGPESPKGSQEVHYTYVHYSFSLQRYGAILHFANKIEIIFENIKCMSSKYVLLVKIKKEVLCVYSAAIILFTFPIIY